MQQVYSLTKAAYTGAIDAQNAAQNALNLLDHIRQARSRATGSVAAALDAFDEKISALLGIPVESGASGAARAQSADGLPAVSVALIGVMNSLQDADMQPTAVQVHAITSALARTRAVMGRWARVRTAELAAINAQLKAGRIPQIGLTGSPMR